MQRGVESNGSEHGIMRDGKSGSAITGRKTADTDAESPVVTAWPKTVCLNFVVLLAVLCVILFRQLVFHQTEMTWGSDPMCSSITRERA